MRRLRTVLAVSIVVAACIVAGGLARATGDNVSGTVTFNASFTQQISAGVPQPFGIPQAIIANLNYTNGTGSMQVDTPYAKSLILAGTTTTIDLTSLTDFAGNAVNFARVREFIVYNPATGANFNVKVESGASNGWAPLPASTDPLTACYGGGMVRISDPMSTGGGNGNVVSGTSKTITLDPGANTVTVYILIMGGSAA